MTVREIRGHLSELYGADVSPDLISPVTDAALDEVREWQSRRSTRSIRWCFSTRFGDILIAVVDRLKGFPEAIASVYPQTLVQTCIVHLIRNSLAFVAWKYCKAILPAIKAIYRAENAAR